MKEKIQLAELLSESRMARREAALEIDRIRQLCVKLLERKRQVA